MDFDSLKKASNLFENKRVSKKSLENLLDDSSEYFILSSIPDIKKRKICQEVIETSLLSKIKDGKLLISSDYMIKEIVSHLSVEGVELKDYKVSGSCITLVLASSKWFVGFIKPKMWVRFDRIKMNSDEQSAVIEYGFDSAILDFAVKDAMKFSSMPFIKNIEKTDFGGRLSLDLRHYINDFDKKTYIKQLNCYLFDLVSFSSVHHSINGINLICDQNWHEIVNRIHMRLDVLEMQSTKVTPSVWMIHKN